MGSEDGLVLLRGQWVEVDHQKLQEVLDHWKRVEKQAENGLSFVEGMRLLAGAPADLGDEIAAGGQNRSWSFVNAGKWLGDVLAKMRWPENLQRVHSGDGFTATLRKYQETGVDWLWFLSSLGLGACLADDMGLGKTVQLLGLVVAMKKEDGGGPVLLVLPASLLANWKAEMSRFTPRLRLAFIHPSLASKEELAALAKGQGKALDQIDVVATSYGMLMRQKWLLEVAWQFVVLDEAQAIKNPQAQQTKTVEAARPTRGSRSPAHR